MVNANISSKALTKDDLQKIIEFIILIVGTANERASQLLDDGKITYGQKDAIFNDGLELLRIAGKLQLRIIDQVLTDVDSAKQVIKNATQETQKAIQKLEEFNRILGLLAGLISIFAQIALSINSGGVAAAGIKILIDGLQKQIREAFPPQTK